MAFSQERYNELRKQGVPKDIAYNAAQVEEGQSAGGGGIGGLFSGVGRALISSERMLGSAISSALPGSITGLDMAREARDRAGGQEQKFIQSIQEKRARGEALRPSEEKLLNSLAGSQLPSDFDISPGLNLTNRQVAGAALGTGLDIASAGSYGALTKGLSGSFKLAQGGSKAANALGKVIPVADDAIKFGTPVADTFKKGLVYGATEGAASGAGFGFALALQNDSDIPQAVKSAIGGAAVGGILGGAFGAIAAKSTRPGFRTLSPNKGQQKIDDAVSQYKKGLQITKEKYKQEADRVIPQLLRDQQRGTLKGLLRKAERKVQLTDKEYQKLGELSGTANMEGVFTMIDDRMNELRKGGRVISAKRTEYRAWQGLKDDLLALRIEQDIADPVAFQQDLRELAQQYGDIVYNTRKSVKTVSESESLGPVKKVDSAIRELLNSKNPSYSEINKVFSTYRGLQEVLEETAQRQSGKNPIGLITTLISSAGGAGGLAAFGPAGAVLGTSAAAGWYTVMKSTWWNTLRATQKYNLAQKMLQMSAPQRSSWITLLNRQGPKAAELLLGETLSED